MSRTKTIKNYEISEFGCLETGRTVIHEHCDTCSLQQREINRLENQNQIMKDALEEIGLKAFVEYQSYQAIARKALDRVRDE